MLAAVLLRPRATYLELASGSPRPLRDGLAHAAGMLGILAAMIAYTATGRLNAFEAIGSLLSFAYVPFANLLGVGLAYYVVRPPKPFGHVYACYTFGYGPVCLALLAIAAGCLLAPAPGSLIGGFAIGLLLAFGWGTRLTYLAFRDGAATSRGKSAFATLVVHVVTLVFGASLFAIAGQLIPLFVGGK
jgi:Yip1 domain